MARKFLYVVAALIVLALAALFALNLWSKQLTEFAFVPRSEFVRQNPLESNAYNDPAMWYSRPGIGTDDPARWQPRWAEGVTPPAPTTREPRVPFAVFFVHPTSYLDRAAWNAPLDDPASADTARLYLRGMATPFNQAAEIWAPRYRQATFGAFLRDSPAAQQAIDAAYQDVRQAYAFFLATVPADRPIVLVGHSQGALHLLRLLREEFAAPEQKARVAAIYAIGWPISVTHDLPALGFPACATPEQGGCILSWSSYAEPADPSAVLNAYGNSTGFDGQRRAGSPILCTNPLTGTVGGAAPADANPGTLVPQDDLSSGVLTPRLVPARCAENGLLLIGPPPEMGNAVLPGNNYHVYDIPLFWQSVQDDVGRRVSGWAAARR